MPIFNCHFTATNGLERISRRFRIAAATQELAVDVITEQIGSDYADLDDQNFTFGATEHLTSRAPRGPNATFAVFENFAKGLDKAALGDLFAEYIVESNHNGWDGFNPRDLTGIRNMLRDMMLYYDSKIDHAQG